VVEDGLAVAFPSLDTIDVVLLQPLDSTSTRLGPQIVRKEGDGVTREGRRLGWLTVQFERELLMLGSEESNEVGESGNLTPIREADLDFSAFVAAELRDDPELEKQELNVGGKLLASRRVRDLDGVSAEVRG